ncbi:M20/M25/M40 family metallo-hydrolase [Segetibacter sp.]|uniref:M20/M25/M40 family metallo-hydrolase n=1 Tax=Segetibacter sp. TaxID=2231182 RepID=UPI002613C8CB|nr:M20/M25/M40 family metallo-hydrolase [Segetibacter sp.]MCW3081951.1 peptidase [Segetibacter sp.]
MKSLLKVLPLTTLFFLGSYALQAQEGGGDVIQQTVKVAVEKRYQNEIKALSEKAVIKSAFKAIMDLEPETEKNLVTLTEIPAPPYKEQKRAEKYLEMMKASGVDSIWMDKAGNVIALRKGKSGKKTVVIEGHLDTVFPEGTDVTVKHRGDTLAAPGIGDDTRGLALVLAVLRSMNKANVKTDANILFAGVVGEEGLGDLRGTKELFSSGLKIDSYIAVDGGGIGGITYGGVGSHRYRITFKGPGGHSYGAFGLANPHNAAARAIHYFVTNADAFTKSGIKTTYNIGVVGGGTSVNAIPYESWMEVDMRSESAERLAAIDKLLQAALQRGLKEENEIKRRGADLTVDIKLVGDRPSGVQNPTIPLLQRAMASANFLGAESKLGISSTNSNIPISKGVPAATIGRGGVGGGGHALTEWWVNDKGYLAIQNALLILVLEAGLVD